jgi:hypothetical protein
VQSAFECKTCADATFLIVVAIVSTLGIYGIGVVLGQKVISDVETQAEDPTLDNKQVSLHSCSAASAEY